MLRILVATDNHLVRCWLLAQFQLLLQLAGACEVGLCVLAGHDACILL